MAITLADFDKIWASTSPLTPYSFSDANYKRGWNFVGATPPARQMWDSYMKLSDEKQQYIVNNFLPLSGGTMTGTISKSQDVTLGTNNASYTRFNGGTSYSDGASLALSGKSQSGNPGSFALRANDGTNIKDFRGNPDGALTWGGFSITQQAYNVQLDGSGDGSTHTFHMQTNFAVIFAMRGNNASIYMVDTWSNPIRMSLNGTDPITVTKGTDNNITITNVNGSAVVLKILNGGGL